VKGGRLAQVSIARSFSKKIFDDYKTPKIPAQNVRANLVSRQKSQSFMDSYNSGYYQYQVLCQRLLTTASNQFARPGLRLTSASPLNQIKPLYEI
tara:strand:- start:3559 stop:3843 length:285 start_codon:yes stop_codon:yes gene_type:complete